MDALLRVERGTAALWAVVITAALGTLIGCGRNGDTPETGGVSGTVTYQGSPVEGALVTLHPEQGPPATGRTDAQGRFTLTTFRAEDGAVPGTHKATVELMPEGGVPGMEVESTGVAPIPRRYADPETTPLEVEVRAGEAVEVDLELTG